MKGILELPEQKERLEVADVRAFLRELEYLLHLLASVMEDSDIRLTEFAKEKIREIAEEYFYAVSWEEVYDPRSNRLIPFEEASDEVILYALLDRLWLTVMRFHSLYGERTLGLEEKDGTGKVAG